MLRLDDVVHATSERASEGKTASTTKIDELEEKIKKNPRVI